MEYKVLQVLFYPLLHISWINRST